MDDYGGKRCRGSTTGSLIVCDRKKMFHKGGRVEVRLERDVDESGSVETGVFGDRRL